MFVMGIFRILILIFAMLSFISRGPASLGFFNSMIAGRNISRKVMVAMAVRVKSVFEI